MIKAIIFDYGGVLTFGRYTAVILKGIEKRHGKGAVNRYQALDDLIVEMDSGEMGLEGFVEKVNEKIGTDISFKEMHEIFEEVVNLNPKVIELIKKTGQKYRVLMLSNNDPPTIGILRKKHSDLLQLFEKTYFSCELKMRKPSKEIFEHLLKDAGLKAGECVFIDDKEKNVKAAEALGFKAVLFRDAELLEKDLTRILKYSKA